MQRKNDEYKKRSVFEDSDTQEPPPSRREILKAVGIGAMVLALFVLGLWAYEADKSNKAEIERLQRENEQKAVAAMMVSWPQRTEETRKTKMVQIARGTTGQADFVSEACLSEMFGASPTGQWHLTQNGSVVVSSGIHQQEWIASSDGMILPPNDPSWSGVYQLLISAGECGSDEFGTKYLMKTYEFEVIEDSGTPAWSGEITVPSGEPNICPGDGIELGFINVEPASPGNIYAASDTGKTNSLGTLNITPNPTPTVSGFDYDYTAALPSLSAGEYVVRFGTASAVENEFVGIPFTVPTSCFRKRRSHMAF